MKLKWTIEVEVDPQWVADGFFLDDDRAKEMVLTDLIYAGPGDVSAKVVQSPPPQLIAKLQGFSSVKAMEDSNKRLKAILAHPLTAKR